MVDPKNITKYDRTEAELQEFFLFSIVAAGKNSDQMAAKLDAFLRMDCDPKGKYVFEKPFQTLKYVEYYNEMDKRLRKVLMGQYKRIGGAFSAIANDPAGYMFPHADVQAIEKIPGIGPKTARFFVLHTRKDAQVAALDTHILRWLREYYGVEAPKATPPAGPTYRRLEATFLAIAKETGFTPAELDLRVWTKYSGRETA